MKGTGRTATGAVRALSPRRRSREDTASSQTDFIERTSSVRRRRTRTPRPPKDIPDLELTEEELLREWGLTKDQEVARVEEFRRIIESETGPLNPMFDNYYLRRFLRARQHDLRRAKEMFLAHLKWRIDFGTNSILDDFHFDERDAFLTLYPQGYHKTDKLGRPVYIQHLGQINVRTLSEVTSEERMLRFHVQEYERAMRYIFPACSLMAGRHISQTLAVMDLKGVGLRHFSGDVKRILGNITRTDQDNYPETLGKTLIINAPVVFRAIWAVVKPMLDPRTQAKIEVCPPDYMKVLSRWVDPENIPAYLGGNSQGSLLDDVGPWNDPSLVAEIDAQRAKRDGVQCKMDQGLQTIKRMDMPSYPFEIGMEQAIKTARQLEAATPQAASIESEEFHDAITRRLSSASAESTYFSADEASESVTSGRPPLRGPLPQLVISHDDALSASSESGSPSGPPTYGRRSLARGIVSDNKGTEHVSFLARLRALEAQLPAVERPLRPYLNSEEVSSNTSIGQGTLLRRVAALEAAMDTLLRAQQIALVDLKSKTGNRNQGGCSSCCSVM